MITGCNHITLSTANLEQSCNFYKDILGFQPLCCWDKGAYFLVGELWVCLNYDSACMPSKDLTHVAFTVDEPNFHKLADKIRQSGAKIYQDNSSEGLSLYFLDPAGHKIEIHVGNYQTRINSKRQNIGSWQNVEFFDANSNLATSCSTYTLSNSNLVTHTTALASHYDDAAANYDLFNEEKSAQINASIATLLRKYEVKTVGDFTCGTGSQLFYLHDQEFTVAGSDINSAMLEAANNKLQHRIIKLLQGNMVSVQLGCFDAVITIHSAIGHLTKEDFILAMHNINKQLVDGGVYIFDIFNLEYLLHGDNIARLTIDWLEKDANGELCRYIQYSTIDEQGVLASYTTAITEANTATKAKTTQSMQTLQVYKIEDIKSMLQQTGFNLLEVHGIDRANVLEDEFIAHESERILVVAKKSASNM
jgi:2-polyprenyl-3-methyl-5-hydroxy-6-metoxy-1,4-benzoquinol methylase/catechol 2,3-dioxygenase-like lactoylglutathione lyase family enzyme